MTKKMKRVHGLTTENFYSQFGGKNNRLPRILSSFLIIMLVTIYGVCNLAAEEMPLPPDVAGLPTIVAEPWLLVDPDTQHFGMEGPVFDKEENLYVCRVAPPPGPEGRVIKIAPDKTMTDFFKAGPTIPVGIAVHKDGRFFLASLTGDIIILNPDGSLQKKLHPKYNGESLHINDLVFDKDGNFFFTDFRGFANNPVGGVYRLDAADDYTKLNQIVNNLASPNGISMSPEGNALWVAEPGRNAILRLGLTPDGKLAPFNGMAYVYYNTGDSAPDSNKVDSEGNLYQAMMGGGRVLILDKHGVPVANVLIPGRERGMTLMSPNLVIKPGTDEAYVLASGPEGSWIYKFTALARAQVLYSHQ